MNEWSCFVCCVYHWEDNNDEYFDQLLPGQLNYVPTFKIAMNLRSFIEQHNFLIDRVFLFFQQLYLYNDEIKSNLLSVPMESQVICYRCALKLMAHIIQCTNPNIFIELDFTPEEYKAFLCDEKEYWNDVSDVDISYAVRNC